MSQVCLEEKYPELKKAFPENFIYFFDSKGNLNFTGLICQENLSLKNKINEIANKIEEAV